jgi:PAS domain S-box-containing protein
MEKKSEKKYTYLIENSMEGVWVIDQHANTVLVNPSMAEMLGYIVEDMIGKSLFLFMEDKVTQETKFSLEKRKQGISEIRDTEMIHRNGNKVYLRLRATPIFNIDGNYDGTYAFLTDITQQKLAEKKLKESEEKQRLILENANDLITILNQDFKHEYINEKAYYDLLGYTSDDLIGQSPLSYLHPNDIDKAANILREGYEKGSGMYVFRIKAKNGQYKWLESRGTTFIDLDGKKKGIIISRDFTESKKADQKLRESEEKYRSLFENMNAGFAFHKVITDDNNKPIDYEYIEVNPIFEKLTGLKKEELIGKRVTEAIPGTENDPADWIGRFGNVCLTGIPLTVEEYSEAIKKWFTVSGYSPRKGYFAVTFTDITDIKRAEQKLKESEEQFRTIAEQSFMGIIILQDGLFKYFNKQAVKINGYTMEEIQNWEPYEFKKIIHPEDREFVMEQARKKQMGDPDVVTHYQYRVVKKNGQVIWVDNFSKTINYKGKPADFVMTIDISDKIKAEQQLKESEENFRNIAEQAFMGIMIIQDDKLEYINNALLQTFEFSHEEVESWRTNDLIKLIYPEDLQDLREYRLKLQGGESDTKPYYSYRVFTKYGRIKWIDQFSKPIIYRGRPAELITIMDITEKKKAEEELIKLNSLKSELLRRTSHELKTPLVSIKGFSDLLLTVHKEKLDDYVLATIHEIRLGCERLESLIQDILKTAELESDSVELKKSEEDLSFLIKLCVKELRGLIKLRNHEINLEIHDKLITHFEPDQIHLVISNILNNAIKYTPPNGKIEIRSALRDDSILISVHDNGIGLTYEEKKRLFSQFGKIERYGQGLDIISDGSGLGLFITKKIVELHGGRIWVRSKGRNKGSTFYFTLPLIVKNKA